MALFLFDGTQNVEQWIAALELHFEENSEPEDGKVPTAMTHLSPTIRACLNAVAGRLENFVPGAWAWTWLTLRTALLGMSVQITRGEEERNKAIIKGLVFVGLGVATAVALPFAFLGVLGAMGFGAGGVAAGSLAAAIQSSIGLVEAGSLFAFCQSAAAGGVALSTVLASSTAAGAFVAISGTAEAEWERLKKQTSSYSWSDADDFIPSPALVAMTLGHAA